MRLSGDEVRFRITRAELARLLADGSLEGGTRFPGGKYIRYVLAVSGGPPRIALDDGDRIVLEAARAAFAALVGAALEVDQEVGEGARLKATLEVDLFSEEKRAARSRN